MRLIGPRIAAATAFSLLASLAWALPAGAADGDAPAPVEVAVVVPITAALTDPTVVYPNGQDAPDTPPDLIDAPTLEAYTGPAGILTARLAAVAGTGATLAIDPRLIASIRALGSAAPASATAWLDTLAAVTNPTMELSWGGSDVTVPLQAGRSTVVRATSLDFAIDPTLFAAEGDGTDAGSTPDPETAPPLPDGAELTRWNYTAPKALWPRSGTVTDRDLEKFLSSGYTDVILAESNARRRSVQQAVASIGDVRAYVVDDELAESFRSAIATVDDSRWELESNAVAAGLGSAGPGASVLLAIEPDRWIEPGRMTATLARIAATPGVAMVGLGALADVDPVPRASLIERPQDADRVARVKELLVSESAVSRFAAITAEPGLIRGERRVRLLNAVAAPPSESSLAMSGYLDEAASILSAVRVEPSSDVTLSANRGDIQIAVRNDLEQEVTVHLRVRALNPNLEVLSQDIELVVEGRSQRNAAVPVRAVSNGDVALATSLRSSSGLDIGDVEYVTTYVRAGWEGPVTLIGGIVVTLVFAAGIARTVVKRRRARPTDAVAGD